LPPDTSVKKVLIYRLGSLGDTVVALPCFHLIARTFPHAERVLLTNFPVHSKAPASAAVLGNSGLVHRYVRYTMATRRIGELLSLIWQIRRYHPDVLIYLTQPRRKGTIQRDFWFFRICGISRMIGLPDGDLACNRYDPASDLWEHEASRLLRCMSPLGNADAHDLHNWDLLLTDAETHKASELLAPLGNSPFLACGPGTKMQSKDWGQEKWRDLLEKLSAELPQHALVMIGAKEERAISDVAAARWKGPIINLCGALSPRESAAVIRCADLFLGPDSGPMHLAAAYGVPCAIPFSSIDHRGSWFPIGAGHRPIYHPVACRHCMLNICIEKKKICINSISVDEMFEAALQAMRHNEAAQC